MNKLLYLRFSINSNIDPVDGISYINYQGSINSGEEAWTWMLNARHLGPFTSRKEQATMAWSDFPKNELNLVSKVGSCKSQVANFICFYLLSRLCFIRSMLLCSTSKNAHKNHTQVICSIPSLALWVTYSALTLMDEWSHGFPVLIQSLFLILFL